TYLSGTTAYINAQAGKSGSFQAAATSTDSSSRIPTHNFPSPSGFSRGGGHCNSSPFQTTYTWSGAVSASGSQTITSHNNASLTKIGRASCRQSMQNPTSAELTNKKTNASKDLMTKYKQNGNLDTHGDSRDAAD